MIAKEKNVGIVFNTHAANYNRTMPEASICSNV